MTLQELHYDFDLKIDKVATFSKEDFTRAEKDWLLNEAQKVFVKTRITGNNVSGTAFETTQKRIDDLSSLVVKFPQQPEIIPIGLDGGVYELPLENLAYPYLYFIRGQATVLLPNSCTKLASLKLVQHDDLNYLLEDPFNNSDYSEIVFNFGRASNGNKSSIYLYPGIHSLGGIRLEYVKKPSRINYGGYAYIDGVAYPQQECELPEHTHSEIVDLAVQIASGIIESPEYVQLKTQKVFLNE